MSHYVATTGLEAPLIPAEEREELVELVDDEDEEQQITEFFGSCWDYSCLFFIMPTLLLIQFYVAFRVESHTNISQNAVAFTIFLFMAASYMYKTCIQQDHNEWMQQRRPSAQQLILLAPEILMDIVLGVVLVSSVAHAFEALLYATMALAIVVILSTGSTLYKEFCAGAAEDDDDEENEATALC